MPRASRSNVLLIAKGRLRVEVAIRAYRGGVPGGMSSIEKMGNSAEHALGAHAPLQAARGPRQKSPYTAPTDSRCFRFVVYSSGQVWSEVEADAPIQHQRQGRGRASPSLTLEDTRPVEPSQCRGAQSGCPSNTTVAQQWRARPRTQENSQEETELCLSSGMILARSGWYGD
jgi:hypothetical protein